MAAIFDIRWDSHGGKQSADDESLQIIYIVADAVDQDEAIALADSDAPISIGRPSGRTIFKQDLSWAIAEGDLWHVTFNYGLSTPPTPGNVDFTFDTAGGTENVKQSIQTVNSYALTGTAPDFGGLINVESDGVKGVDIPKSAFKWTETHTLPLASMTFSYGELLEALTNATNASQFRGKAARTVIFRGAQGGKKDEETGVMTFAFEKGAHATNLTVGGINGIEKEAWDYLWALKKPFTDASSKQSVLKTVAVYVERVSPPLDFSLLGIGTEPL